MRTLGLVKNIGKEEEDDPIMKLNPTLYKAVSISSSQNNFTNPFQSIMEKQSQWIDHNKSAFVKNLVYRTDLDHPNSMHSSITGQSTKRQVQFPKTMEAKDGTNVAHAA